MNKIHRVVRDSVTGTWVVTSELSRARGKSRSLVVAAVAPLAAVALLSATAVNAQTIIDGNDVKNVPGDFASPWTDTTVVVGSSNGSDSQLNVTSGSTANLTTLQIGLDAGSKGTVNVLDGSSLNIGTGFYVGSAGTGVLNILNGGQVTNNNAYIGQNATGVGAVVVDGAGSKWVNNGNLEVGWLGSGSLTVSNGGAVDVAGKVFVAGTSTATDVPPASASQVVVTGAGSALTVGEEVSVGQLGTGTLLVSNGGAYTTNAWTLIGNVPGSDGTVTVTGTGSSMTNMGDLSVGHNSTGRLELLDGATASVGGATAIGKNAGATGIATVSGTGTRWNNAGDMTLGMSTGTTGTLNVDAGGQVINGGNIIVGNQGAGTLNVADQGLVSGSTMNVASAAGSTGTVNIGTGGLAGTLGVASIAGGAGAATVNFNHTDAIDFAPSMTGSLSVNKLNSGSTTLSGMNDYTGATSVQAGVLEAGVAGALSANSAHAVSAGATLGLGGFDQTIASLDNAGVVAFSKVGGGSPTAGTTLTVNGDYVGNNGTLLMNTALGDDTSATDKLVVKGNTSGNTFVQVKNAGGAGAQTNNGIELVNVGGQSDGTFQLQGRAVAGAYEYLLKKGSNGNPADGNWYLRSDLADVTPPPAADPVNPPAADPVAPPATRLLRPEPAAYLGNQSAAVRMFEHSLHDRVGEPALGNRNNDGAQGWVRVQRDNIDAGTLDNQIGIDGRANVLQMGIGKQFSLADGSRLDAGVMAGYGEATTDAQSNYTGYQARGEVKGSSIGVYGTWHQRPGASEGLYVDTWAQYGRYNNSVQGDSLTREQYDSRTVSGSLEAGYAIKLNEAKDYGVYVEPQAQVIHTRYSADTFAETNGTLVQSQDAGGTATRLGMRLYGRALDTSNRVQPFVTLNWWNGGNASAIAMDGVAVQHNLPNSVYEVKAGVQAELASGWSGFAQAGYQTGSGGYSNVTGQIGVKLNW